MDRIAEVIVTFVVNAAWQTAAIALIGIGTARLLRRAPANLRFWLVVLTLVVAVASPVMTMVPRTEAGIPRPTQPASPSPGGNLLTKRAVIVEAQPSLNRRTAGLIAIVYLAGALFAAVRLLVAGHHTRRLLAHSRPFAEGVRISDNVASPVTIGKTILLPPSLADSELLPAALAHERAHVRRSDFAVNALLQVTSLPLWFHPIAALLRREIAELRELACDEEAARQLSPRAYAAALVRIAAMSVRGGFVLGMASSSIERRVATLRRPPARSRTAAILAVVAIAIVPLALFAACTRASITPAIARPTLNGRWSLVATQSDFGMMVPHAYDAYTQSIAQDARGVSVRQHRVSGGRSEDQAWHVVTDGRWRAVDGIPAAQGRATWREGRLDLTLQGPGAHTETVEAWISGGRLICDGNTERGHFRAVFQRED
ncbi:MAG TPA: M56 family metallopeptidase [Thermoanaerobaculia bacterium]|nr:M56 family metallopeptidase [Thermoanaerobaculia bacterium]